MIQRTEQMSLRSLFSDMGIDVPDISVTDITCDSRAAQPGGLFIACRGRLHHGLEFLSGALAAGIRAVAWEPVENISVPELPTDVINIRVPDLYENLGVIADRFYSSPSAEISVTGITGTNGKTTTAWLVAQAFDRLGIRAGYMGTIGYGIGPELSESELTTPDCVTMHCRLRQLADAGAEHVITEVSSHALDQRRVDAVHFSTAALTNLSRDHLDYHGSMQQYAEAKARLFTDSGIRTAVINVGESFGAEMAGRIGEVTELISVAVVDTDDDASGARLRGRLVGHRADGIDLAVSGDFGDACLNSGLWGRFNAENLAMAVGILLANGIALEAAVEALGQAVAPPGRMELIRNAQSGPTVVVDFAHTPAALEKALATTREHTGGEIWCVFGCGGNRDRGKRASMGMTAAKLADRLIVTDDNPRDEDPAAIVAQIVAGVSSAANCEVLHDRQAAIETAIAAADDADVVLVAGKGHESVQEIGDQAFPFSDALVAREALARRSGSAANRSVSGQVE